MEITLEKLNKLEMKITVSFSEEEILPYKAKATSQLQSQVKVDGFRSGKVPMEVLEQKIGHHAFMGKVLDLAIGESYEKAIQDNNLMPIDYPKINVITHNPLKYEAIVTLLPEIEWIKDLSDLKLKKPKFKVEDKEVDEVLENLLRRSTKWKDVDRPAKMEDRVEINFEGFDKDGIALEGTSSKNHPVILGSNSLIPGFEEEVVGMKKDEEKEFQIVFPKDYHSKKFQNKKVKFKVKLCRLEEPDKPELNDAFANEITGGHRKTLKALKEEIIEELHKQKERQEELQMETDFLKELSSYVKAEIPQQLIDHEIDFMIERMKEDLKRRGKTWEEYEKELKEEKKDIRKELSKSAKEQVLTRLALEDAYKKANIEVTDDEIQNEVEEIILRYPPALTEMARKNFVEGGESWKKVHNQIRLRKLVSMHVDK